MSVCSRQVERPGSRKSAGCCVNGMLAVTSTRRVGAVVRFISRHSVPCSLRPAGLFTKCGVCFCVWQCLVVLC